MDLPFYFSLSPSPPGMGALKANFNYFTYTVLHVHCTVGRYPVLDVDKSQLLAQRCGSASFFYPGCESNTLSQKEGCAVFHMGPVNSHQLSLDAS